MPDCAREAVYDGFRLCVDMSVGVSVVMLVLVVMLVRDDMGVEVPVAVIVIIDFLFGKMFVVFVH